MHCTRDTRGALTERVKVAGGYWQGRQCSPPVPYAVVHCALGLGVEV